MKKTQNSNYDFFVRTNTSNYQGQWVAIAGKKIVSHGNDAQKVYENAKKKTSTQISLAKVPDKQVLVMFLNK